jgi:hypothetical protein
MKEEILFLIDEIKPPLFLSHIDIFQNIAIRLYVEFHLMSDDLVTIDEMFKIALPILETNITEEDIKAYREIRRDPAVCRLMAKCVTVKNALMNGRLSQMVHNYERIHIKKQRTS